MNNIIEIFNSPLFSLFGNTLSNLEVFGFLTGIWCVWLIVKKKMLNFPVSIINALLLFILFADTQLFADATLQLFFIALSVIGWYQWIKSPKDHDAKIEGRWLSSANRINTIVILAVSTIILYFVLTFAKGSVPIFDAFIGASSVVAQILLNKRYIENWIIWIVVDIISVPVYAYKELNLIALLYVVFLGLAITGFHKWCKEYNLNKGVLK